MSDFFGIGAGIRGATEIYFRSARGSGRTINLLTSLKDGDRVVFTTQREAQHAERMAKERGIKLSYMVVDPANPSDVFKQGSVQGRNIFDHNWVEQFYRLAIDKADKDIRHLQVETSGYGEKHLETKHRIEERRRWEI